MHEPDKMRREMVTEEEFMALLRKEEVDDLSEVKIACLEVDREILEVDREISVNRYRLSVLPTVSRMGQRFVPHSCRSYHR